MIGPRLLLLLVTAAALAGYAAWSGNGLLFSAFRESSAPPEQLVTPAAEAVAAASPSTTALNPLSGLSVDMFKDMVERPLFNPSRAPAPPPPPDVSEPAVAAEPVAPSPPVVEDIGGPEDFTLLAVVSGEQTGTALIRSNKTGEVLRLQKGQSVSEWQLIDVGLRDVTLGFRGKTIQLKLFQTPATTAPEPDADESVVAEPPETE